MLSENSTPKVILPDNWFQTVVNTSEISFKLVFNVIPNSTQNISVISFQTVLKVIGKTHSRQYLILSENWYRAVLNVIREFISSSDYFYQRIRSTECLILSKNPVQTVLNNITEYIPSSD